MKYFIVFLCLFFSIHVQAQGSKFLQTLATKLSKQCPTEALTDLSHQISQAAATSLAHDYFNNQLSRQPTKPSMFLDVRNSHQLTLPQIAPLHEHYQQTLDNFADLKKQIDPFLYYQTIPSERHTLSQAEKRHLLGKILPLYIRLRKLHTQIDNNQPLEDAYRYMEFALSVVDAPLLQGLQLRGEIPQQTNTSIDKASFCLYPSSTTPLPDPFATLEGKSFAIINDNISILNTFEKWFNFGILFPNAQLHTNGSTLQFLLWFTYASKMPDIIFTDIQLGDGTGYYLVHKLRERGYQGGIIALTSYEESEKNIQLLAAQGFDGFISLKSITLDPTHPAQRLTQAAQIYLMRQEKNPRP